jgi:hypothetical protein
VGAYSVFITLLWYGKYSLATHGWKLHQFTGPSTILNNALTFHFLVPHENILSGANSIRTWTWKHEEMRHLLMRHARNRTNIMGAIKLERLYSLLTAAATIRRTRFTWLKTLSSSALPWDLLKLLRSQEGWLVAKAFHGASNLLKLISSQDWLVAKASSGVGSYDSRSKDAEGDLGKVHGAKSAK